MKIGVLKNFSIAKLLKIVLVLSAVYNIYYLYFKYFGVVGDYVSLYFYSAIFQGNAALITLSAMFIIYKKQALENEIFKLENVVMCHLKDVYGVSALYSDVCNFENFPDELINDLKDDKKTELSKLKESPAWKKRFEELKVIKSEKDSIWRNAFVPIRGLFLVLMSCALLLILVTLIHSNIKIEFLLLDVVLCAEIVSLFSLFDFMKKTV